MGKEDWQWRIPFKTSKVQLGEKLDKKDVFAKLDSCLQEIFTFEVDLANKLSQSKKEEKL